MKTTPQSVRCRVSRIGCNSLSNQQKETKFNRWDDLRSSWFSSLASAWELVQKRREDAYALRKLATGRVRPTGGLSRNGPSVFRRISHAVPWSAVRPRIASRISGCLRIEPGANPGQRRRTRSAATSGRHIARRRGPGARQGRDESKRLRCCPRRIQNCSHVSARCSRLRKSAR